MLQLEFPEVVLPDMGSSREGRADPVIAGDRIPLIGVKIPNPEHGYERDEAPEYRGLSLIQKEKEAAVCSSDIASHLMISGSPVNGFDILIAGTAASRQATGIITSERDFEIIAPTANLPVIRYDPAKEA